MSATSPTSTTRSSRARREEYPDLPLNEAIRKVTEKTEKQFHDDVAALGCLPPTVEPRATQHIDEMKAMIEELIAKGFAYVGEDHVLFRVSAMADYGRLSNRSLDEMVAGARVEVAPYKQDPMDFVLWKPSKPGEPAWPSPAGIATPGRPGWHLECSAMSDRWLWEEVEGRRSRRRGWPIRTSSTSTAAASTSSSRTMRTRSPSRAAPTARR